MLPEVFIIESLRQEDHREERLEGNLIAQILRLGGRNPIYNLVESRDQFIEAIEQFGKSQYRYLHLSCHGSVDSFEFYFGQMTFEQFTIPISFTINWKIEGCLFLLAKQSTTIWQTFLFQEVKAIH